MFNNVVLAVFDHYWQTFDSMNEQKVSYIEQVTVKTEIEILDTWIINITGYQEGTRGK